MSTGINVSLAGLRLNPLREDLPRLSRRGQRWATRGSHPRTGLSGRVHRWQLRRLQDVVEVRRGACAPIHHPRRHNDGCLQVRNEERRWQIYSP